MKKILGSPSVNTAQFFENEQAFQQIAEFINSIGFGLAGDDAVGNEIKTVVYDTVTGNLIDEDGQPIAATGGGNYTASAPISISPGNDIQFDPNWLIGSGGAIAWDAGLQRLRVTHDTSLTINGSGLLSVAGGGGGATFVAVKGKPVADVYVGDSMFSLTGLSAVSGTNPGGTIVVANDPPLSARGSVDTIYASYDSSQAGNWSTAHISNLKFLVNGYLAGLAGRGNYEDQYFYSTGFDPVSDELRDTEYIQYRNGGNCSGT